MTLAMSRPWKHPSTGVYWLRKRVPAELRPLVGKTEEKQSLGTKDPAAAKLLHSQALLDVERRWANLRQPKRSLSEREAHELAARVYDGFLSLHAENPSEQKSWDVEVGRTLWTPEGSPPLLSKMTGDDHRRLAKATRLEIMCRGQAEQILHELGVSADEHGLHNLEVAVARAFQKAAIELQHRASGIWPTSPRQPASGFPQAVAGTEIIKEPLSFESVFNGWAAEKQPSAKTRYAWKRILDELAFFIGHSDASLLKAEDLIRWKESLIAAEFHPKTIRDTKLAPVRAIMQWAADNRRLDKNPAERITIKLKAKPSEGRRGYTDDEAKLVLTAAHAEKAPHLKWIPLLCAYSGARVSEVCQLRAQDIIEVEDVWCMSLTAEAGSLKNVNSERLVPLHSAVVAAGFLAYARGKAGPLFEGLQPDRFGNRGGNGTKILSRWVRSIGIVDLRLAPSHSWRHRLKTLGRRYGLELDLVDAMTGHRKRTVADSYGEFPINALSRELEKIPALQLNPV